MSSSFLISGFLVTGKMVSIILAFCRDGWLLLFCVGEFFVVESYCVENLFKCGANVFRVFFHVYLVDTGKLHRFDSGATCHLYETNQVSSLNLIAPVTKLLSGLHMLGRRLRVSSDRFANHHIERQVLHRVFPSSKLAV